MRLSILLMVVLLASRRGRQPKSLCPTDESTSFTYSGLLAKPARLIHFVAIENIEDSLKDAGVVAALGGRVRRTELALGMRWPLCLFELRGTRSS